MSHTANDISQSVRLRHERIMAGYETATDFAKAHNFNLNTYIHHETGRRGLKPEVAMVYARALNLPASFLLYGEQLSAIDKIPIVGIVNSNGEIASNGPSSVSERSATFPDPASLVGMQIAGDELYPAYKDGDLIYYRPLRRGRYALRSLNGLECVCELHDGRIMMRQVAMQSNGLATLIAYRAPPLSDCHVVAASPIELVRRNVAQIAALPRLVNQRE